MFHVEGIAYAKAHGVLEQQDGGVPWGSEGVEEGATGQRRGGRLDHKSSVGHGAYSGLYPKSNGKSWRGLKQRGM